MCLLIGRNIQSTFQPLRIIHVSDNEPWAEEYKFGWTIIGPVCVDKEKETLNYASVDRITVQSEYPQNVFTIPTSNRYKEESVVSFATRQYLKDVTSPQQVREMMQLDYSELYHARNIPGTEKGESVEDKRFSEILTTNIHKNELGNWEMPLPFKTDAVTLPNNRERCLKRLLGIKKKFLWFKDNNLDGQIMEYRMNVYLFGAVSSPGVANFGLRITAEAGRQQFGPEAANILRNDFYVDDGLKSFDTHENAIKIIKKTQAMCATVNVRLHKFASNSKTVLEALLVEDRPKDLKNLDLRHNVLPVLRSLATYWCIESDVIGFCIQIKDKPLTRRGILSTVSSVYDPLGIVAPVILVGKQLLQELCRDGID